MKLTEAEYTKFYHKFSEMIERGTPCYFCQNAHGQAQWILKGIGFTYICPDCVEAGKVTPMILND